MVEVTQARELATALISVERFDADGNFHPDYLAMLDKYRQAGVQQGLDMEGWVIGDADGKRWRSWGSLGPVWVTDPNEATRYHRRCDAENVHGCDEDAWLVLPFSAAIRKLGGDDA